MGDEVERTTGGVFDDPLATRINEKYREVEGLARSTLKAAIELGGMLQEKKSALPHGEWGRWVKAYFEGSERQAQRYMQVYAARDKLLANPSRVSDMSLREGLRAISPRQKEDQKEDREDSTKKLERKLKDAGFNRRFAAGLAQGLVQGAVTRERVEGPLRWAGVEAGEEPTEPREQLKGEGSEDKDDYDYAQSLIAKVKEGGEEIEKIVRIPVADYVVRRKDGNTMRVARKVLLEAGWKKCSCCDGYGITNSA